MFCRVRIVTDCTVSGNEDINEEASIKAFDLKEMYYDLKDNSKIIIEDKRLTAVSENRLLSVLILNPKITWDRIIN